MELLHLICEVRVLPVLDSCSKFPGSAGGKTGPVKLIKCKFPCLCWQGASEAWHIPVAFISVIILPIIGNAAEHTGAIVFAIKDNLVS